MGRYYDGIESGMSEDSLKILMERYYALGDEMQAYDSAYLADESDVMSLYLLRNRFYTFSAEELEARLELFDESLHPTTYYTYLSDHLSRMKSVDIGEKFVDFSMQDTSGTFVSLSDFAGKGVLLIDFWASWCPPCRKANPEVVEIYNEFKDKGFDIVGVSLDNSKKNWKEAIVADNLTWAQMSDLQGWESKGAHLWAVAAIPHTVLLDEEGTIIARNLEKNELREKLTELLGS
jgi:peroxiredoxin